MRLAALLYEAPGEIAEFLGDVPGWHPRGGYCHANVDEWVALHSHYRPVRGWLRVEYETPPNRVRFHSHSVVEDSEGRLLDVTLSPEVGPHIFIRHPWSHGDFMAAVQNNGLPYIDHELTPDDPAIMEECLRRSAELPAFSNTSEGWSL